MTTSHRRPDSGVTMLEVMVAVAILGFIMFAAYSVLHSTTTNSARGQMNTNLEAAGKEFIEFCKKEFYDARFNDNANTGRLGIHDFNTQVHYQLALGINTAGGVVFGYPGSKNGVSNTVIDTGFAITIKGQPQTVKRQDFSAFDDWSAVLRFEPELVYYEGTSPPSPDIVQPATADTRGPQAWQPNVYANSSAPLAPGTKLPIYRPSATGNLNIDMNRDGDKTDVFVKGRIWKYVMRPYDPLVDASPIPPYKVVSFMAVSDNVFLPALYNTAAAPGQWIFRGDMDALVTGAVIRSANPTDGKDWLFRYIANEPSEPPSTYGVLDTNVPAGQAFPATTTTCLGITVWHGILDDGGKFFHLKKTWERVPFRLNRITGF